MGWFKIKSTPVFAGGSAQFGADTNLYRASANLLKTDDGFSIAGTPAVLPYSATSPTVDTNGQIAVYHKAAVPRIVVYSGGTPYALALPAATHGTLTITVNSVP